MKMERERRTPEQDDEDESRRHAAEEREIDRGDWMRDEMIDRMMEEKWEGKKL